MDDEDGIVVAAAVAAMIATGKLDPLPSRAQSILNRSLAALQHVNMYGMSYSGLRLLHHQLLEPQLRTMLLTVEGMLLDPWDVTRIGAYCMHVGGHDDSAPAAFRLQPASVLRIARTFVEAVASSSKDDPRLPRTPSTLRCWLLSSGLGFAELLGFFGVLGELECFETPVNGHMNASWVLVHTSDHRVAFSAFRAGPKSGERHEALRTSQLFEAMESPTIDELERPIPKGCFLVSRDGSYRPQCDWIVGPYGSSDNRPGLPHDLPQQFDYVLQEVRCKA